MPAMKILVAVTGGSGFPLVVRMLDELGNKKVERHLVMSKNARVVMDKESELGVNDLKALSEFWYEPEDISSRICSGSFALDAMVIMPCSMNTLAKVANGIEDNAIARAAGVSLKQERPVILVPRETPLTLPQLENMVKAKRAGCSILPPVVNYYIKPRSMRDLENYIVGRVFELIGIKHELYKEWGDGE
ncbi:MAG: UbiX family flavin prenyltransferase [Candidatus Diapherotrites archaeon]|nr:UbiX family flavin prenyltransferase [Candidatus Diapherotrites archaeon]